MLPEFVAHNTLLNDGTRTIPGKNFFISNWEFCKGILRTLDHVFQGRDHSSIRIADLGCLEGGYSVAFARQGYQVLGIEVREKNFQKCLYVKDRVDLPNLKFMKDDVRNIENHGTFDAVFCGGVLYHLDKPVSFLKTLGRITKNVVFIQSHYASGKPHFLFPPAEKSPSTLEWNLRWWWMRTRNDINHRLPEWLKRKKYHYCLSRLSLNEGRLGRWSYEYKPWASLDAVEDMVLASYKNPVSFWLHKKDLLQSIKESGFGSVYEQYDCLGDISSSQYIENHSRSLFVGIKSAAASSVLTNQNPGVNLESNEETVFQQK